MLGVIVGGLLTRYVVCCGSASVSCGCCGATGGLAWSDLPCPDPFLAVVGRVADLVLHHVPAGGRIRVLLAILELVLRGKVRGLLVPGVSIIVVGSGHTVGLFLILT